MVSYEKESACYPIGNENKYFLWNSPEFSLPSIIYINQIVGSLEIDSSCPEYHVLLMGSLPGLLQLDFPPSHLPIPEDPTPSALRVMCHLTCNPVAQNSKVSAYTLLEKNQD